MVPDRPDEDYGPPLTDREIARWIVVSPRYEVRPAGPLVHIRIPLVTPLERLLSRLMWWGKRATYYDDHDGVDLTVGQRWLTRRMWNRLFEAPRVPHL